MSLDGFTPAGDAVAMLAFATALSARAADAAATVEALRRTTTDIVFEGLAGDRFFSSLHDTTAAGRAVANDLDWVARSMLRDVRDVEHANHQRKLAAERAADAAAHATDRQPPPVVEPPR
jgi:uncharacterized protein YukE